MTPQQIHETRMRRLAAGDRVRLRRADLRAELKRMSMGHALQRVAVVVERPDSDFRSIRVGRLLAMVPYLGARKIPVVLGAAGIHLDARLKEIAPEARNALARDLRLLAVGYFNERAKNDRKARAAA